MAVTMESRMHPPGRPPIRAFVQDNESWDDCVLCNGIAVHRFIDGLID